MVMLKHHNIFILYFKMRNITSNKLPNKWHAAVRTEDQKRAIRGTGRPPGTHTLLLAEAVELIDRF